MNVAATVCRFDGIVRELARCLSVFTPIEAAGAAYEPGRSWTHWMVFRIGPSRVLQCGPLDICIDISLPDER